jgi:hypothetical protein
VLSLTASVSRLSSRGEFDLNLLVEDRHERELNVDHSDWQLARQFIATGLPLRWASRRRTTQAMPKFGFDNGNLLGMT